MTWYARIFDTDSKTIRYESLKTVRKTEAHDLVTAKTQAGEFERKDPKDSITTGEALSLYLESLEHRGIKSLSVYTASVALRSMESVFDVPLRDLTKKALLEAFLEANKEVKPNTYNMRKTYLKSAFKYFVNVLELIPSNIADVIPSRKNNAKEKDFWTLDQIDRILDNAPSPRFRLMWSLMAFAGLRIHEAINFKPEDVKGKFLYVVGKGNKPASMPVSNRLKQELELAGDIDLSNCSYQITTIRRVAKIAIPEGFHGPANNHRFRHSFASNLIRSGVGAKQVQKLMRHASIATTLNIYSHLFDEDLNDSVEKMFK